MFQHIVILTGSGISAESGIRTYRGDEGLWENHRLEDVATPEAFAANPDLVYRFYNERRRQLKSPEIRPNPAHEAIARLQREYPGQVALITQNVDNLHEQAGSKQVWHMHGALTRARCTACEQSRAWHDDLDASHACPDCGQRSTLRPDIVWFGEMPMGLEHIVEQVEHCDLFIAIGTSGVVYPAAGLVQIARQQALAHTVCLTLDPPVNEHQFHDYQQGLASELVPQLVDALLAEEK
ncbi:MAG: NAD-dependent deacetylase [Puniceicoccaceae bacterium 5H]|nr:MAG: NAD-dependent deacetylase [Puniceicoccaceae bacterium 5H]